MRRTVALVVVAVVLAAGSRISNPHIHAYVEHDHLEHRHGLAVHDHEATDRDHDDRVALERCDPGGHARSIVFACGCAEAQYDVSVPPAQSGVAAPVFQGVAANDVEFRDHDPPHHRRPPSRAPPLISPA